MKRKHVFISHHHADDKKVDDQLTELLNNGGSDVRNSSVRMKPANQRRMEEGRVKDETIRRLLRMKISWASTVVVLIGKDTHTRAARREAGDQRIHTGDDRYRRGHPHHRCSERGDGVIERIPLTMPFTVERLEGAILRVARHLGQDLTMQNPILNTRLPDGSRVAVVGAPSSINGPTLTIRKFNNWYSSDQLVVSGSMPASVRDLVVNMIMQRKNGIIAGGTGSGKTTLMKALLDHIPSSERLCIIEQPAELQVLQPNAIRWEAVEAIPGQVAVTPSELLAAALRHRPDRIIMGEIRNECGYDLLQAMNTGHGGTMSTIHAKSAWDALNRLANLALSARANLNHGFIRSETAEAIDYVLYCERAASGRRQVRELITVEGYDHHTNAFLTTVVYQAQHQNAA